MGILDFLRKPKKVEPVDIPSRFCIGYQEKRKLNSVTEDGKRGYALLAEKIAGRLHQGHLTGMSANKVDVTTSL